MKTITIRILIPAVVACLLIVVSCGKRNPSLSDKQLQSLMDEKAKGVENVNNHQTEENKPDVKLENSKFAPLAGGNYSEIRSVDSAHAPEIIDIAGNLENKKAFKLSDIASSVRYVQLQQPPDAKIEYVSNMVSDDEHIFIRAFEGLFCYSTNGQYLYTIVLNEIDQSRIKKSDGWIIYSGDPIISGISHNVDLLNGKLVFHTQQRSSTPERDTELYLNVFDVNDMDAQMRLKIQTVETGKTSAQPQYQRQINTNRIGGGNYLLTDDQSLFNSKSLTGISLNGDTLCKFVDYDRPTIPVVEKTGASSYIYRIGRHVMLHKGHNDTIFRIEPPNRFIPVYIMQWGEYKPNINEYIAAGDLIGALVISKWVETSRYIFIEYTEGRSYPNRLSQGKVKFHWAIYDKTMKTLTHVLASSSPPMAEGVISPISQMFENDLDPVGMPFWPTGVNHNNEMYMTFSKEQVKNFISTGSFQNDKLQAIYDQMPDDGICIMIVK